MTIKPEPRSVFMPCLSAVSATMTSTIVSSDRGTTPMQKGDGEIGVFSTDDNGAGLVMSTARLGSTA